MRRSRTVARDPFFLIAKFSSVCPETGKTIRAGERIAYFPATRRAYHTDSNAANELHGQLFAKSWNMADANW